MEDVGARGPPGASLLLLLAKLSGGDEEEEEEEVFFRLRCPRSLAGFLLVGLSVMEADGSDSRGAASGRCCWVAMVVSVRVVGSCSGRAEAVLEVD